MIMNDSWWIAAVDHRISTALIFFMLLLLLGKQDRRPCFPLRLAGCLTLLCCASWCTRYAIDAWYTTPVAQGLGYSLHIMVMAVLYWGCYAACYHATVTEISYNSMLSMTIYKLAWNTFKTIASAFAAARVTSPWSTYSLFGSVVSYLVYAAVCLLACFIYKWLVKNPPAAYASRALNISVAIFLLFQMMLEYCGHVFVSAIESAFMFYVCALMYTVTNYIVLVNIAHLTRYRKDNEEMQAFIANKMQYYQMSRDGITSLQIKCHDLKHQIAAIRSEAGKASFDKYIDRLEDSIIEYGTVVECGNETINVVLTEKNILCSTCGVKFSYLIDGSLFDFMTEMELYSLFGNALDNALESCNKVSDPEKRVISLKAMERNGMIVLHVENFFAEPLNMVDGMPVTTKGGIGHGFGLRSIREIAEKYNGVASIQTEGNIFKLTVILRPSPA